MGTYPTFTSKHSLWAGVQRKIIRRLNQCLVVARCASPATEGKRFSGNFLTIKQKVMTKQVQYVIIGKTN
jgi:hypothetical protein